MKIQFNVLLNNNFLPEIRVTKNGKKFFLGEILDEKYMVYIKDDQLLWFQEQFKEAREFEDKEVSVELEIPYGIKRKDKLEVITYFTQVTVEEAIWDESEFDNFAEAAEIAIENSKLAQNKSKSKSWMVKILDLILG